MVSKDCFLKKQIKREPTARKGLKKVEIRRASDEFKINSARKRVHEKYKEYDETYLRHYVQYFFWFFCVLGIFIFGLTIFLMLDSHYHWTK